MKRYFTTKELAEHAIDGVDLCETDLLYDALIEAVTRAIRKAEIQAITKQADRDARFIHNRIAQGDSRMMRMWPKDIRDTARAVIRRIA